MSADVILNVLTVLAMLTTWWVLSGFMAWLTAWTIGNLTEQNLANGVGYYLKNGLIMWARLPLAQPSVFENSQNRKDED